MKLKFNNRRTIAYSIIAFYLIPILVFSAYSINQLPRSASWFIVSLGFLLTALCSLLFTALLYYWEQSFKKNPPEKASKYAFRSSQDNFPSPNYEASSSAELLSLKTTLEQSKAQYQDTIEENERLTTKANQIAQEYSDYKIFSEEQLKQKNIQLQAFQKSIDDQQSEAKQQQDYMEQLHTKVRDLSYEIKTLLSINERDPPSEASTASFKLEEFIDEASPSIEKQVDNEVDASLLLKRCINTAQKLTGAYYYGNELSRYKEFSPSHSAIDLRRLFDSLRMENEALILVYSPKDQKLLFCNAQSKSILGWNPEKLISDFLTLIQEGSQEWKKAVNQRLAQTESIIKLLIKAKSGQDVFLQCHLGLIPTGLFRGYIICVLYAPSPVLA